MENNTNTNPNIFINSSTGESVGVINNTPKKMTQRKRVIIIVAIIIFIALVITYLFLNKKTVAPYIPTALEKAEHVENVINETEKIGLPSLEVQVDIMKYNQSE